MASPNQRFRRTIHRIENALIQLPELKIPELESLNLDSSTLADKGYIGLGLLTPTQRKSGVRMRIAVKENNRRINRLRSVVERTIAPVLTWRVLHTGFRRLLGS